MFNLACVVLIGSLLMLAGGSDNSPSDYSTENVRDKLRKSEFDNFEVQDIARKLRRDSDFRYNVEKDVKRGVHFDEAIKENLK